MYKWILLARSKSKVAKLSTKHKYIFRKRKVIINLSNDLTYVIMIFMNVDENNCHNIERKPFPWITPISRFRNTSEERLNTVFVPIITGFIVFIYCIYRHFFKVISYFIKELKSVLNVATFRIRICLYEQYDWNRKSG